MNHRLARSQRRRNPQAASRTSGGAQPGEHLKRNGAGVSCGLPAGCGPRPDPGAVFPTDGIFRRHAAECRVQTKRALPSAFCTKYIPPPISTPQDHPPTWSTVSGPDSARLLATWPYLDLTLNPAGPGPRRARAHHKDPALGNRRDCQSWHWGMRRSRDPPVCHALRSAPGPGCPARRKT